MRAALLGTHAAGIFMKIIHVIPELDRGGAERVVVDLANHAVERGHQVTILCAVPGDPARCPRAVNPKVELRYISSSRRSRRAAYLRMPVWLIKNCDWLFEHDVVHCHLTGSAVFGLLLQGLRSARRGADTAVVETYHAVGMAITRRQRLFHRLVLGRRDAVIFMADDPYWQRFRAARPAGIFRTIPNGVTPLEEPSKSAVTAFREQRTRIPADARVLGSVGRLVPARRPDLLLETFAHLARLSPEPVHMLFAGEGPERTRLEQRVRQLGLEDRVHFAGLVLAQAEPLATIDLYLTMNIGATTGIAALEAIFAGVPVIAMQLQNGYDNGDADWIPSRHSPEALAQLAADLLGEDARLKGLAAQQKSHAEARHGVAPMAEAYEAFYEDVLNRRRGRALPTE